MLGLSDEALEDAAQRTWGRSLTTERERRLDERLAGKAVSPRSRQALRGHITRELLEELREAGVGPKA